MIRYLLSIILVSALPFLVFSQKSNPKGLHLDIILPADTLDLNKEMFIQARLTNGSKSVILVSPEISLQSNIYPNGLPKAVMKDACFRFYLGRKDEFPGITYENLDLEPAESYDTLMSGESRLIRVDIGSHIHSYNLQKGTGRKRITNVAYPLELELFLNYHLNGLHLQARVRSRKIKVYFK